MNLKLTLTRTGKQEGFTTGVLHAGTEFLAHTLEPQRRDLQREAKVKGCTAVPEGTYQVRLQVSPRFKRLMPYLQDVPGFEGVMLHYGNRVSDSAGCILVGERAGHDTLKNSRITFERLYERLFEAHRTGKAIAITIQ